MDSIIFDGIEHGVTVVAVFSLCGWLVRFMVMRMSKVIDALSERILEFTTRVESEHREHQKELSTLTSYMKDIAEILRENGRRLDTIIRNGKGKND